MPSCNHESSVESFLCASQGKTHRCQAQGCCVSSRSSSWYRCLSLCRPSWMTPRVLDHPGKKVNLFSHDLLPSEARLREGFLKSTSSMRASGVAGTTQQGPFLEKRLGNLAIGAANLFPLWLVIGATSALAHPPSLAWFKREYITKGLALTMLSMGTTLTLEASSPCCLTQLSLPVLHRNILMLDSAS